MSDFKAVIKAAASAASSKTKKQKTECGALPWSCVFLQAAEAANLATAENLCIPGRPHWRLTFRELLEPVTIYPFHIPIPLHDLIVKHSMWPATDTASLNDSFAEFELRFPMACRCRRHMNTVHLCK